MVHQDGTHVGERMEVFADHSMRRREDWSHAGGVVTPTGATGGSPTGEGGRVLDGPAYEVMFLLRNSDEERVAVLKDTLDGLGDSLLVVGGPDLWNVHVHVDDVGAAVEAGIDAGRPYRVRVTHLAVDGDRTGDGGRAADGGRADQTGRARPAAGVAVVACAAGPGLAAVFTEAGAQVVSSGPGRRASAGQLLDAAKAAHAVEVIVLPNDGDTVMAAEAAASAAEQDGVTLHVVRSRTAVQGLAALAVFDVSATASRNVAQMSHAAAATRHGAVAIASKQALTSAGPCEPGDVLGAVAGDVVIIGSDLEEVAIEVVGRLLSSGGEIVTVIGGVEAPEGLTESLGARIEKGHRDVEVSVIDGGQPHYPLLLGVE